MFPYVQGTRKTPEDMYHRASDLRFREPRVLLRSGFCSSALESSHGRSPSVASHRAGESRWLSVEAESGGAGHGAWEISPATR